MKNKSVFPDLLPAIFGALLLIGVLTVFSACGIKDDGTWMRCHSAQNAIAICGAVTTVVSLLAAFIKNRAIKVISCVIVSAASIIAFLLPGTIMPMCMMNTMRCYTVMQPFVRIMTVIIVILAVWRIISALRAKTKA